MFAVVAIPPSCVRTPLNGTFITKALYVVQPYVTVSSAKHTVLESAESLSIPKCTTYDLCIVYIPAFSTNRSPMTIMKYFYSSFPFSIAVNNSQSLVCGRMQVTKLFVAHGNLLPPTFIIHDQLCIQENLRNIFTLSSPFLSVIQQNSNLRIRGAPLLSKFGNQSSQEILVVTY